MDSKGTPEKLLKPYDPKNTEERIYSLWEESGFFNPDVCIEKGVTAKDAEPFSIVLPPPNVTGTLHTGHALMLVIEDIMTRYARMQGKKTLWLPGTDHAAIATQSKVEKLLQKEGIRKQDLGREEFLKRVDAFAKESHDTIVNQTKRMGASLDWSREAFTLDKERNFAVRTAFKRMYDEGLIYRGHRIVNWDPKGQTVISDDELVYQEEKTKFYYFKYGPFTIGTARPETKFGDKYVIMHPEDVRYSKYEHGQKLTVEWINGPIEATIIKDPVVDMEFGTGVMTITPWHSVVDFELAEKHKLSKEQVIDKYGKLLPIAGEFAGMKISEAREKIVEKMQSKGLVEKIEDYTHNIATAERTGAVVEPQIMNQWFIDVNKPIASRNNKTLKELMLEPVRNESIKILPRQFENVYFNWINNLRDWCISRQIWYGHQVPVWYKGEEIFCNVEAPKEETNFVFLHGKYRTREIVDPLNWLSEKLSNTKNFWEILPKADSDDSKDAQMKFVLENAHIDENTVIVCHSRGGKLAMKLLEETGKKIKGLVLISTGIGERKVAPSSGLGSIVDYGTFDFKKIQSLVKERIIVFEASEDHLYGPEAFSNLTQSLGAIHHKAEKSSSHYNQTEAPEILAELKKFIWTQDEDTLDTWFSSGLWTFSTLGWPEKTNDLATYHPTTVLETGYDIIFFWVARMILMSEYHLGEVPFKTVYLHGLVRDGKGNKMSKSLGNIVNPLDLIEKYGTDALRMAMIVGVGPGSDSNLAEEKIKAYSKFSNKLWNITRFVLENTQGLEGEPELDEEDTKTMEEFDALLKEVTKEMNEYKFYLVAEKLYHFVWHTFADIIIERSKKKDSLSGKWVLRLCIPKILRALHPFMPFVTEELWSLLPKEKETLLIVEKWPCSQ